MKAINYFSALALALAICRCSPSSEQDTFHSELKVLRDSIEGEVYKDVNAIVVYQNGEALIEEYYNGTSKDDIHDARSVGKSITSALLGIALDEGYLQSLQQPISDFYDLKNYENYDPKKEQIKLRDLVTMTSNFDGDDSNYDTPGNEEYMYDKDNWVQWTLNLPLDSTRESGDSWKYFTAGTILIGDILNRVVPDGLEQYSAEKLFGPLENKNYKWSFTPQGVPSTAGNFRTTAIGFADFGQLYLNGGTWNGERVISEQWISESLTSKVKTTSAPREYGYFWWIKDLTFGDSTYRFKYCTGNGGNKIYVIEDLDAVIVIMASAYGKSYGHSQAREITSEFLLPIISKK